MNQKSIDEIKAREQMATPGPWENNDSGIISAPFLSIVCNTTLTADADFIAHARADIPALIAEVERLTMKLKEYG